MMECKKHLKVIMVCDEFRVKGYSWFPTCVKSTMLYDTVLRKCEGLHKYIFLILAGHTERDMEMNRHEK